ncbi:hypothetical protein [Microbacterium istanbulense]|uniref:Uncharacterized protein n=1 Tax=Microbacterium istanbulense TaxID=3122049 RepID=A0ABU8LM54_9MICO
MTAATLHLVSPTRGERRALRIAAWLTAHAEKRITARAERRELALDLLREQQTRRQDPRAVDLALAHLGLPLR